MSNDGLSLQQRMSTAAQRETQRVQDDKRRSRHFQVRLGQELADQLQHYADAHHHGVKNAALKTILSKFFHGL